MRYNKKWNAWIGIGSGCCLLFFAVIMGYMCKKRTYFSVYQTEIPYNTDFETYAIDNIDSAQITIFPPHYINNDIEIRVKCNDKDFLEGCSPLIVGMNDASKILTFFTEYQYGLRYERNKVTLPKVKLPNVDFILSIGYYRYAEIAAGKPSFHCVSYKIAKGIDEKRNITRFWDYAPREVNGKNNITTVFAHTSIRCYRYQYNIDSYFNGFKDEHNQLINEKDVVIVLLNGSKYSGFVKNGFFEGKGTYHDNLIQKVYENCMFTKGNVERDSLLDAHTFIRITERPLLSEDYPIGGCYKTENTFADSVNVKRINYIYRRDEQKNPAYYRQVIIFSLKGDVIEQKFLNSQDVVVDNSDISPDSRSFSPIVLK